MKEIKYTWRVRADDDNQALLKMSALTKLGSKLEARDIELLSQSQCLSYFVSCARLENEGMEMVLPLTIKEEKIILRWRKLIQVIQKILPFLKPKNEINYKTKTL